MLNALQPHKVYTAVTSISSRHGEAKSKVTHGLVSLWWVHKYKDTQSGTAGAEGKVIEGTVFSPLPILFPPPHTFTKRSEWFALKDCTKNHLITQWLSLGSGL